MTNPEQSQPCVRLLPPPFVGVADKLHCIVDELLSLCIAGGGAPVLSVDFAAVGIDRAVIVENQFLPMFYLIGSLLDTLGIKVIDLMADVLEACQAVQLFHADIIALAADLLPACEETSSFVDTSVIVVLLVFDPALFQDALGTENIIIIPDFLQAFEGIAFFVEVIGLVSDRLPAALEVFSVEKPVAVFPRENRSAGLPVLHPYLCRRRLFRRGQRMRIHHPDRQGGSASVPPGGSLYLSALA